MQHRSPARFLAPLAVVAVATAAYLIVQTGVGGGDSSTTQPTHTTTSTAGKRTPAKARRSTYVVRPGDTLSAISARTGISLADLHELNPSVDANTLHAGQKLTLRKPQKS